MSSSSSSPRSTSNNNNSNSNHHRSSSPPLSSNNNSSGNNNNNEFTLKQVSTHNSPHDCYVVYQDRVLDITKFRHEHPGGPQILVAAGLDATVLVESYHPRGIPTSVLDRLTIGKVKGGKLKSYYVFDSNNPDAFYPTLKRRVHQHLKELHVKRRGSLEIYVKSFIILSTLIISWYLGWVIGPTQFTTVQCLILACIHGAAAAHVGMSIMHDANHAAFSNVGLVNRIMGFGLDLIGASGMVWSFQHVVSHHAYTNLETRTDRNFKQRALDSGGEAKDDDDLALSHENDVDVFSSFPMVRMHPGDKRAWFHRYQHIYSPFLFGLFTLVKIFMSDAKFYLSGRVSHVDMHSRLSILGERIAFLGMKVLNIIYMIAIPWYLHGPSHAAMMLVMAHFVAGEYLAIVFIVSHISEGALFYSGGAEIGVEGADPPLQTLNEIQQQKQNNHRYVHPRDWAALQATSTVNWAAESWFWGAFSGGLNTQLEHHLFPGVNHTAYRFASPIVREVCQEFGVPYVETRTLGGAIMLCMKWLRDLGRYDNPVEDKKKRG
jgi:fatty acid desaturase/cytochrome b involved in lipid metabolism